MITWETCSGEGAHGRIANVTIQNNPVSPGSNTTVFALGFLDKPVTKGKWQLVGSFMGIPLLHKAGYLCEDVVIDLPFNSGQIYVFGLDCPTEAGMVEVMEKAIFYNTPPSGLYNIKCTMTDQDSEEILCLSIDIPM